MQKKRKANPKDQFIGKRIREFRLNKGMSQTELGLLIEVTFQQVQKYENGTNRISAGRLHDVAVVLGIPIIEFFEGIEGADVRVAKKVVA